MIKSIFLLTLCLCFSSVFAGPFDEMQAQIILASDQVKNRVVHLEVVCKQNQKTIKIQGSGFIIDSLGHVITNDHVVDKAEKITVTVPGIEDKFSAAITGTDKLTDLALLRMDHPLSFPPVKWAEVERVRVGEWAIAIGNPYGLDRTVSLGIVSAIGRAVPAEGLLNDFIQTDAMIDMGSSGGPLINLKGEVLGVNSMIMGRGIGFTVPADVVIKIIGKLKDKGSIERSWVGISLQPLTRDHAEYFGIPGKKGVIVTGVFEGSPAEKAGVKPSDIIVSLDGVDVAAEKEEDLTPFKRAVSEKKVGETLLFEIYDIQKKSIRKVKVATGKAPASKPREMDIPWGIMVKEITTELHRENFLFSREGVVVTFVRNGSDAEMAGLEPWDIIQKINERTLKNMDEFEKEFKKIKEEKKVMLRVLRNRDTYFLLVQKYGAMGGEDNGMEESGE